MGRSTPTIAFDGTIFVCTDSTEIFLSKLRSSCSNYNFCICIDGAFMGRSTPTAAFDGTIFVCTDSTEIFLSKLRSSCSNYNLPSFFTDSYCAGGI